VSGNAIQRLPKKRIVAVGAGQCHSHRVRRRCRYQSFDKGGVAAVRRPVGGCGPLPSACSTKTPSEPSLCSQQANEAAVDTGDRAAAVVPASRGALGEALALPSRVYSECRRLPQLLFRVLVCVV
jgi:hypothetical protein